jgi:hypothetical protein
MEGSVLSFLKTKWKVSDTGSAHLASSLILQIEKIHYLYNCDRQYNIVEHMLPDGNTEK